MGSALAIVCFWTLVGSELYCLFSNMFRPSHCSYRNPINVMTFRNVQTMLWLVTSLNFLLCGFTEKKNQWIFPTYFCIFVTVMDTISQSYGGEEPLVIHAFLSWLISNVTLWAAYSLDFPCITWRWWPDDPLVPFQHKDLTFPWDLNISRLKSNNPEVHLNTCLYFSVCH